MPHKVRVEDLYRKLGKSLELSWEGGHGGQQNPLLTSADSPQLGTIAGSLNYINPSRIQVIGAVEQGHLSSLSDNERQAALNKLFSQTPAAIVLADGVPVDDDLLRLAEESNTPLMASPLPAPLVLDNLQHFAAQHLSAKEIIHGVFLDVLGMGVLLTGRAAVGKSELALELISRGSRLIADDAPEFTRIAPDTVNGECPPLLHEFLEVRGLGILNIRAMFGDNAVKQNKYLRLIIDLKRMHADEISQIDRLTGDLKVRNVLGVDVPVVTLPVAPGRNLAIVTEAAVRNHQLRLKGYDATEVFIGRHQQAIIKDTE